ncbi:MAG: Arc family DNA-binding protein [Pseudomonadales bacterium]|nr:Arc family DNA-binding protein [Pseudomonadales bacterium]
MTKPTHNFVVRFPIGLRDRIYEASQMYRRSMNSEIIARLEQSLNGLPNQQFETSIAPAFFPEIERALRGNLNEEEKALIFAYRRLSAAKRKALIELLF